VPWLNPNEETLRNGTLTLGAIMNTTQENI